MAALRRTPTTPAPIRTAPKPETLGTVTTGPSRPVPHTPPIPRDPDRGRIAALHAGQPFGRRRSTVNDPRFSTDSVPGAPFDDLNRDLPKPISYPPVPYPSTPFSTPMSMSRADSGFSSPQGGGFSGSNDGDLVNYITQNLMNRGGRR